MRLRGARRGPWLHVWAGRPDPGRQQLCAQENHGPLGYTWWDRVFPRIDAFTLLPKCPPGEAHCGREGGSAAKAVGDVMNCPKLGCHAEPQSPVLALYTA